MIRAVEYLARLQQLDRQAQRRNPAKNTTSVAATRPVKQQAGANLANAE